MTFFFLTRYPPRIHCECLKREEGQFVNTNNTAPQSKKKVLIRGRDWYIPKYFLALRTNSISETVVKPSNFALEPT